MGEERDRRKERREFLEQKKRHVRRQIRAGRLREQKNQLRKLRKRRKEDDPEGEGEIYHHPQPNKFAEATCPRCDDEFTTVVRYGIAICTCGFLLKIEPLWNAPSIDDVILVATQPGRYGQWTEAEVQDGTWRRRADGVAVSDNWIMKEDSNQLVHKESYVRAVRAVLDNWERRNIIEATYVDKERGHFGIRLNGGRQVAWLNVEQQQLDGMAV